jgi:elongator complex protein 5
MPCSAFFSRLGADLSQIAKTKIVFISFRTFKKPKNADVFVRAHGKSIMTLAKEILGHVPESKTPQSKLSNISQSRTFLCLS